MLITLEETVKLINEGKILHIAADDQLLAQLPKGNWIGGTNRILSAVTAVFLRRICCMWMRSDLRRIFACPATANTMFSRWLRNALTTV